MKNCDCRSRNDKIDRKGIVGSGKVSSPNNFGTAQITSPFRKSLHLSVQVVKPNFRNMTIGELLGIQPSELKFPFELKKQSSCSMQLANKTDQYIAFKVKTTNPKRYAVRPNAGIVMPHSICNVTVTMQAQKEFPPDMQCRDKFLVQSVIAPTGATNKDLNNEMFNSEDGKVVEEFKLRVLYVPANRPSPVPEEEEEENSPGTSSAEDEIRTSVPETVASSMRQPTKNSSSKVWSVVYQLKQENSSLQEQNRKLLRELELLRKRSSGRGQGVASIFVVLLGLVSILIGYLIRK